MVSIRKKVVYNLNFELKYIINYEINLFCKYELIVLQEFQPLKYRAINELLELKIFVLLVNNLYLDTKGLGASPNRVNTKFAEMIMLDLEKILNFSLKKYLRMTGD